MFNPRALCLILFGLLMVRSLQADPIELSSELGLELRHFSHNPMWVDQDRQRSQPSINISTDLRWQSPSGNKRASLIPYLRYDQVDQDRSLIDLREAFYAVEWDSIDLLLGVNTVFWGVTESVHLVDIINQTDIAADIDGEQKLGQPMINLASQQDWGLLNLYVMPWFRERKFAGPDGRLRPPLSVGDQVEYESNSEQHHTDIALRYSHYIGDVDIGLSLFSGTSREPRLMPNSDASQLIAYYDQINQLGIDLQYTVDAWLWKLESIYRQGYTDNFWAAVAGFEVTQYQILGSDSDLGYLLEYQYDDRAEGEPVTIANNDIFVGVRWALNDIQDSTLLAGIVYDHKSNATLLNIEADRRLGNSFTIEFILRAFSNADSIDPIFAYQSDDYAKVGISLHF